jgi:glucose-6-phosphate-specific signal transduction histidine kinase
MTDEYPAGYMLRIKVLDAIIFLIGLSLLATPAVFGFFPGAFDTTVHVTLGALISVCAVFRILVAYGSAWLEVVLCVLGVLTFFLPCFMHQYWHPQYATPHMIAGAVVVLVSVISGAMTFAYLRKTARA